MMSISKVSINQSFATDFGRFNSKLDYSPKDSQAEAKNESGTPEKESEQSSLPRRGPPRPRSSNTLLGPRADSSPSTFSKAGKRLKKGFKAGKESTGSPISQFARDRRFSVAPPTVS